MLTNIDHLVFCWRKTKKTSIEKKNIDVKKICDLTKKIRSDGELDQFRDIGELSRGLHQQRSADVKKLGRLSLFYKNVHALTNNIYMSRRSI